MAWKQRKGCNSCEIIEAEGGPNKSRLYKLINEYHIKGATLREIADIYMDHPQFTAKDPYMGIRNHSVKHQNPTEKRLVKTRLNEKIKGQERTIAKKNVQTLDARQNLIDLLNEAAEGIDFSELRSKDAVSLLLKALKDSDDVSAKRKDQQTDILRVMAASRSGELDRKKQYQDFDPWKEEAIEGEIVE